MGEAYAAYKQLSKKHKLPDFSKLDNEFEISLIEADRFLLRAIIQKMVEKAEFHSMLIENILSPDSANFCSMHECKFFSEDEKERLFGLYKILMQYNRRAIEISFTRKEEEEVTFVKEFFQEWQQLKKELLPVIGVMKRSWKKDTTMKEELEYLG